MKENEFKENKIKSMYVIFNDMKSWKPKNVYVWTSSAIP